MQVDLAPSVQGERRPVSSSASACSHSRQDLATARIGEWP
jgi:hypothetical protein